MYREWRGKGRHEAGEGLKMDMGLVAFDANFLFLDGHLSTRCHQYLPFV